MSLKHFTRETFEKELNGGALMLGDFWAEWCGPCRMMSPIVDQLADELADVKVCKVDIDQAEALATEYGVEVVPTFIVFENGEAVKSVSGVMPKPVILDMLK